MSELIDITAGLMIVFYLFIIYNCVYMFVGKSDVYLNYVSLVSGSYS